MILNKLLLQQADLCKVSTEGLTKDAIKLLQSVSQYYDEVEQERMHLNYTVEMCSSEMIALNSRLVKESKELRTLFETMREVFFSVNMETGQLINISKACETVYGYAIEDFMNNPNLWAELVIEKDSHIVKNIIAQICLGQRFTICYRVSRKDGCIRWLETKITPTLNEQGMVTRIDGFTSDITTGKNAQDFLIKNATGSSI